VTDASDYTIPIHGEQRDLHHVAIEIRQDCLSFLTGSVTTGLRSGDGLVYGDWSLFSACGLETSR